MAGPDTIGAELIVGVLGGVTTLVVDRVTVVPFIGTVICTPRIFPLESIFRQVATVLDVAELATAVYTVLSQRNAVPDVGPATSDHVSIKVSNIVDWVLSL